MSTPSANWGDHNNKLSSQHECFKGQLMNHKLLLADCATLILWMRVWLCKTLMCTFFAHSNISSDAAIKM